MRWAWDREASAFQPSRLKASGKAVLSLLAPSHSCVTFLLNSSGLMSRFLIAMVDEVPPRVVLSVFREENGIQEEGRKPGRDIACLPRSMEGA